ncbi:MAG: phosphoglucosamine mutase [Epsilonproteobacteria bacterium]|nr:phosphoglucosamine mutase [Campylobacterota bacterium]
MELFGTDGVRGKAGDKLDAMTAMKLAMAAGIYFREESVNNKIIVGKDTRRSGYMIENAIVSGLTAIGYNVIQIGPMPTPAIAFLTEDMRCDAGIMISASHNPFYDNGVKFFDKKGNKLNTLVEKDIETTYFNDELIKKNQKTGLEIGTSKRIDDVIGRYIVHIKNSFPKDMTLNGIRIVIDTANGAAYKVAPTIFKELGAEVFVINNEPNGSNINQSCGALHPEALSQEVIKVRADIGFALDGDADRLVVVDEKGQSIDGDKLLGALAVFLKEEDKLKNSAISATVMSNQALEDFLAKRDIALYRCDVGDKNVLEVMQNRGLNFGGEQSGHIILSDYAKTGDALASALQAIAYVIKSGKKTSEAFDIFEPYPQILENIPINTKKPFDMIEGYDEYMQTLHDKGIRSLVRYSGTENLLRVLLEGEDTQILRKEMDDLKIFLTRALSD